MPPISLPFASARSRARIIKMAADAGLGHDDARAFADRFTDPEAARAELARRADAARAEQDRQNRHQAVMQTPYIDELPEAQRRQIAASAPTAEAARMAAVDALCDRRARAGELEQPATDDRPAEPSVMGPRASVGHSWDHGQGFVEKAADGLAARLNPAHQPTAGREFAHMRLDDLAIAALEAGGVRGVQMPKTRARAVEMAFSGGMHTTSDFAGILAGAAQTAVSEGYQIARPEIVAASRMLSAPDFRERTMYRLSSGPQLTEVNEHGEIAGGTFVEEGEPAPNIRLYARLFNLTIQAIVNDDIGAFADIPRKMAEGAASTVRSVLCGVLEANGGYGPTMRDGNPMFDAAHGNLAGTGSALTLTTLSAAVSSLRRQTGAAGEILAIRPRFIVVPPELENAARSLIADISPEQVSNANPWADIFEVIVEPGLSDPQRWYIAGDPATSDGLAHAYLDGFETPQVDQETGWEKPGISFRVQLRFGASAIDWRSWHANDGA